MTREKFAQSVLTIARTNLDDGAACVSICALLDAYQRDRPAREAKGAPIAYDQRFDVLYGMYPRKVGKAEAYAAWQACGRPTVADMGEGWNRDLRVYMQRARAGELGYVPHLATYFRNRRWEDAHESIPSGPAHNAPAPVGKDWMKNLPR